MTQEQAAIPAWVFLPSIFKGIRFQHESEMGMTIAFYVFGVLEETDRAGVRDWTIFDGSDLFHLAEWAMAPWEFRGHIKWDGCVNWETNPETMLHGCGLEHVDSIRRVFEAIYAVGRRRFEELGDNAGPMPDDAIERASD